MKMKPELKKLKSGSDIRGVAVEGVEGEAVTLTLDAVREITVGFILWLAECLDKKPREIRLAVGCDSRISSEAIKNTVISAATGCGATLYDCRLSSTPAMFMACRELRVDGSIQITASHHPFNRNGMKFFRRQSGGLSENELSAVLEKVSEKRDGFDEATPGKVEACDFMKHYSAMLREIIIGGIDAGGRAEKKPLEGFKITVDAGNGVGGFFARDVLAALGADISGSVLLDPDGFFPVHPANPEDKRAMEYGREAVLSGKSDLGIIFDTDVDRSGFIDASGKEINRSRLIALAAALVLEKHPGSTIVTDSVTSRGLSSFIKDDLKGKHLRFKRGYRNVIDKAIELEKAGISAPLAIETSGHAAFRDNFFLDDGAYLAAMIIILMVKLRREGRSLGDLMEGLEEPFEEEEIRLKITAENFAAYGLWVIEQAEAYAKQMGWALADDNYEGLRVNFPKDEGDGWFLLRLSVHDPVMPLNIESGSPGGCACIKNKLLPFLLNLALAL
jgi:phosphomannomutase